MLLLFGCRFFGAVVAIVVGVGVDGVAFVVGGGIVNSSHDNAAFVVAADDGVSKEWLSLLLVSAASL